MRKTIVNLSLYIVPVYCPCIFTVYSEGTDEKGKMVSSSNVFANISFVERQGVVANGRSIEALKTYNAIQTRYQTGQWEGGSIFGNPFKALEDVRSAWGIH